LWILGITRLLQDHGIEYAAEGHPHCTDGWVNIHCPFCTGSRDYHLGINIQQPATSHCWRCGGRRTSAVLSRVLNKPEAYTKHLLKQYAGTAGIIRKREEPRIRIYPTRFPHPYAGINKFGKMYLTGRKYNPAKIERIWKVKQTGPVSFLDQISYSNRLIIPIYWNGKMVSFQTRDITGKSDRKYLACPMQRETLHHKNILYSKQQRWCKYNALIVVEGVFDVWRLGPCSVATFGTSFKMEQVLELAKAHERFFIIFDNEKQAQEQARKLSIKLKALGKTVFIEKIESDPGDMEQDDADHLVKTLQRRSF